MNPRVTLRLLGGLLISLGAALIVPLPLALWQDGARVALAFAGSAGLVTLIGVALMRRFQSREDFGHREGFALVTFGWLAFAIGGALPYLASGVLVSPVDAFFESMSGFTTTGSTVLSGLSELPRSILLWRSLTQWLGGMGIIVLTLAILPFLGIGGMQLFRAEVPGPTADRLSPRIQDTAKALWGIYILFTGIQFVLLWVAGMTPFDAINHALTTLSTGGFSTSDASLANWGPTIQWIVIAFMFLGGVSFNLHWYALRGRAGQYPRSTEFRTYLLLILVAALLAALSRGGQGLSPEALVRESLFTVVAIITTTGYGNSDYAAWGPLGQMLIFLLLFSGGSAGSTSGGIKVVRFVLVAKYAGHYIFRLVHPRGVRVVKLDGNPVPTDVIQGVLGFLAVFFALFLLSSLALAATGLDLVTATSASITALGNVGPGFGTVGPTGTFAEIPDVAKLLLCFNMLAGRLELFTVLVLFLPSFWRR